MLFMIAMLASAAQTTSPAQDADMRCFAAISYAVGTAEESKRTLLAPALTYYLGRVTARDPQLDLEAALVAIVGDEADFTRRLPVDLARCGQEAMKLGTRMQALGAAMKRRSGDRKQP